MDHPFDYFGNFKAEFKQVTVLHPLHHVKAGLDEDNSTVIQGY